MIYLFENQDNNASIVYDASTLTEQEKSQGIAIEQLPTPQTPDGKIAILKCRKSDESVWYEYADAPKDENEKIKELEQAVLDLTELVLMGGL